MTFASDIVPRGTIIFPDITALGGNRPTEITPLLLSISNSLFFKILKGSAPKEYCQLLRHRYQLSPKRSIVLK